MFFENNFSLKAFFGAFKSKMYCFFRSFPVNVLAKLLRTVPKHSIPLPIVAHLIATYRYSPFLSVPTTITKNGVKWSVTERNETVLRAGKERKKHYFYINLRKTYQYVECLKYLFPSI